MDVDQKLFEAAVKLIEERFGKKSDEGAAAIYTESGKIITSTAPACLNDGVSLCHEVELKLKPIGYNPLLGETLEIFQKVLSNDSSVNTELVKVVKKELFSIMPNNRSKQLNFDSIQFSGALISYINLRY